MAVSYAQPVLRGFMAASSHEIGSIKRIILEHLSPSRARRIIGEIYEKVGRRSANQSLKKTLSVLKKELLTYDE